ncbi:MAG: hypothetical protein HYV17_07870 [Xanthomonadales bacterium]|nr:hypothetical protein [Xanthomonadales bacterium]
MRVSDEHLNYWADEFIAWLQGGTFEQFMHLSPAMRARKLDAAKAAALQDRIERELPQFQLHGEHLLEPLHHQSHDSPVSLRLRRAMK